MDLRLVPYLYIRHPKYTSSRRLAFSGNADGSAVFRFATFTTPGPTVGLTPAPTIADTPGNGQQWAVR